jgi:hypothetical protein
MTHWLIVLRLCFLLLTTIISVFLMMSFNTSPPHSHSPSPADALTSQMMEVRLAEIQAGFSPPHTPSVSPPPAPVGGQIVAISSQPPEFPTTGFQGGSFAKAPSSSRVTLDDATPHTMDPCDVPLGVKCYGLTLTIDQQGCLVSL